MLGNYKQSTVTPVTINVQKQQMTKETTEMQTEANLLWLNLLYLFALPLTCCQLTEGLPD